MAGVMSARFESGLRFAHGERPKDCRYLVQRVIARRQILDIAVVAGEYNGSAFQIKPH